ncbi:uncharacterized protein FA14DRAFT_191979 [Meira miltonrushii]|uniref:18S rRNA factor 2 n=1 Tax=Meira miltonrushii TaxID=1280837 RepID=A0A316V7C4_9BASI|nr:uncharacterized protein FA14DRAFT_191979 [Meira miltonrushii]PWN32918.1 hypothetical protein FA14DRAFT_191979 [Meira miltonrushii]
MAIKEKSSIVDPRFDTSRWKDNTVKASTSKEDLDQEQDENESSEDDEGFEEEDDYDDEDEEDEDDEEEEYDDEDDIAPPTGGPVVKPLSREELEKYEEKQRKKGIIYISRIPHGMTVAKVRHLLSGFGDVERIYLQDGREKERGERLTGRAAKSAHFTEGWVEFAQKKVAKTVADMLNAHPIGAASGGSGGGKGGKKAGGKMSARRWRDEVWTMKYLSGFKWGMLSEQLANERASRASRVRAELSQSTFEQKDYLRKVERARVMRDKQARLDAKLQKQQQQSDTTNGSTNTKTLNQPRQHTFRQREAVLRDVREQRDTTKRKNEDGHPEKDRPFKSTKQDTQPPKSTAGRSNALQGAMSKIF